ncbi:phage minor head protein [Actinomadura rugatobispora]|uniref:Phage minor head protein n=1 Tax=Actinomadura rugatobispora TaxID=1994 RepID=A0ABW0ZQA4_9ACTN|nr:hypothetical protein GCM10010200_036340 [Actinomadura rugatobispora]
MAFTSKTLGLARAAITAAGRAVDAVIRTLTAAWVRAWDALTAPFTTALDALLAGREDWPGRRTIETDPALQQALGDAAAALDTLAELTATEATRAASAATERAAADQAAIIDSQLPPGRATMTPRPGGFHQRAIDAINTRAQQRIISLTRPLSRDADAAMRRELVRGVQVGRNPRDSARRMVKQVEGAFNGGLTRASTIARTETISAYREAAAAIQDASRDVLAGWTWLAELSDRTCIACWSRHGTDHPLTEPGPQGHVNCRCSRAPRAMSWRDLGIDLDEPEDDIPNAEAAFWALPRATQLRIMGAARLELFDRGAVAWEDFAQLRDNPGWRPSWNVTPIKDLVSR